jgi:TPR repeat protein
MSSVPTTPQEIIKCFHAATAEEHPVAMHHLGLLYYRGDGVPRDNDMAVKWFQRSAKKEIQRLRIG